MDALENMRKRVERLERQNEQLKTENEQLQEELNRLKPAKWKYSQVAFTHKRSALENVCEYGLTHFCDGTVNLSEADNTEIAKPRCPKYKYCQIRHNKLEEIPIEEDE